uniref:Putative secreted protein n=1 Tax=Panstrongylus lignarius TaxID=156445 RepID=A0A224Y6U6_9HEMI
MYTIIVILLAGYLLSFCTRTLSDCDLFIGLLFDGTTRCSCDLVIDNCSVSCSITRTPNSFKIPCILSG